MPKYLEKWLTKPITAIIDTREQYPLELTKFVPEIKEEIGTLDHGDYSLSYPDMQFDVCIERKSRDDFIQSMTREHKRFQKELLSMRGYKHSMVVIECEFTDIFNGNYRSMVNPNAVMGFISYWMCYQKIPILFCRHHDGASYIVGKMLWHIAMREAYLSMMAGTVFPGMSVAQMQALMPMPTPLNDPLDDMQKFYEQIKGDIPDACAYSQNA